MRASGAVSEDLAGLRHQIAGLEGRARYQEIAPAVQFAVPALDAVLGGGLEPGAVHEVAPAAPLHAGAATGFAFALAALADRTRPGQTIHIATGFGTAETGAPYGLGLSHYGTAMARVLLVQVPRPIDVLWAMEEALGCRGVAAVIAMLPSDGAIADLTATRRLALAARERASFGLILRQRTTAQPSAAATRWEVAAAPSRADAFGGLGPARFALDLTKNRRGRCGRFVLEWIHHERAFADAALSGRVVAAPVDRPARPPLRRAG